MKLLKTSFLTLLLLSATVFAQAQSATEIINGSYFIAFGRFANSGELSYWKSNLGGRNMQQMVDNHRGYLQSAQAEREATVRRSYLDAFGWAASADEVRYWSGQNKTYAELMANHINNWLNVYPDRKEAVIRQSYMKVFRRNATADEVRYWMGQSTFSYVQLVAMHTTWQRQNARQSTATAIRPNLNTNGISTAGFSANAAAQAVAAGGGNIIGQAAGNVVAAGSGNVVAAGSGN